MIDFITVTGAGGFAWDYGINGDWRQPSTYAEWKGWMKILSQLRAAHPDIVMDHRQTAHKWGPWYQLAGSYVVVVVAVPLLEAVLARGMMDAYAACCFLSHDASTSPSYLSGACKHHLITCFQPCNGMAQPCNSMVQPCNGMVSRTNIGMGLRAVLGCKALTMNSVATRMTSQHRYVEPISGDENPESYGTVLFPPFQPSPH
jgi:hypothetical protein